MGIEYLDENPEAKRRLDARYAECDREGHKKPDSEANLCNYCFRHLEYSRSEEIANILKSREGIPLIQQPLDASRLADMERNHINLERYLDKMTGLLKMSKEIRR